MARTSVADRQAADADKRAVQILAGVAILCIVGYIGLAIAHVEAGVLTPLIAIGSASVGAISNSIRTSSRDESGSKDEDEMAIIGRAATKSIIAEAMRQMGSQGDDSK